MPCNIALLSEGRNRKVGYSCVKSLGEHLSLMGKYFLITCTLLNFHYKDNDLCGNSTLLNEEIIC